MAKTLADYEAMIPEEEKTCYYCRGHGEIGHLGAIEHYDHEGGWTVEGFQRKQWLYKTCMRCGYQWALWKLGVPRELGVKSDAPK